MSQKIVETSYTLFGCRDGCKSRGGDSIDIKTIKHPDGYKYQVQTTSPSCRQSAGRSARRADIYRRAAAAADAAEDRYNTLATKLKGRRVAWDGVAAEWVKDPCPFYEAN